MRWINPADTRNAAIWLSFRVPSPLLGCPEGGPNWIYRECAPIVRMCLEITVRAGKLYSMSAAVQTIESDTDIVEVAEIFLKKRCQRFPVVTDGRLVGIISRCDALRALEYLW